MTNFFNFNYTFPFGMNNWFMPNWSFPAFYNPMQMPYFNIFSDYSNLFNFNNSYTYSAQYPVNYYTSPKIEPMSNIDSFTRSSDINYAKDNLKLDDYNAFKGERLAKTALNRAVGWKGYCAAYVKSSIQASNLGSYQYGHAYQMPEILRNNPNFKEISPEGVDVSKLPAGCILVYDKGAQGYNKKYGHTEITTGDGRAVSDGITKNLYKKPSNIFIPV